MDEPHFHIERLRVPVHPLDELRVPAAFVKLDVQGAELQALRGLRETIDRHRPVLLVETPGEAVRRFLAEWRYEPFTYDARRYRLAPGVTSVNAVFVQPPASDVHAVADRVGTPTY